MNCCTGIAKSVAIFFVGFCERSRLSSDVEEVRGRICWTGFSRNIQMGDRSRCAKSLSIRLGKIGSGIIATMRQELGATVSSQSQSQKSDIIGLASDTALSKLKSYNGRNSNKSGQIEDHVPSRCVYGRPDLRIISEERCNLRVWCSSVLRRNVAADELSWLAPGVFGARKVSEILDSARA